MSTPAGDDLIGDANIRINADTDPAIRALGRLSRDAQGRIRDIRGRFVSETDLMRLGLVQAAGGGDRFSISLRSIANAAGAAAGILGRVGLGIGAIGAAAGTAAPLLAGIVTTLQNVAPAGAVAVTGMLAVQQASAVVKLGMVGIEDAATAAFDTSTEGTEKFNDALEKLAPNAREFAVALREAQPAFQKLQQGVQNRLFAELADELGRLATQVLPIVRTNLNDTATTLNQMALGASSAARELATNGTLGKAMAGANEGLENLREIPGQVVTALGQLAAAGAPAFDRLTSAAASAATGISERLSTAFKSGALTDAVDTAIGLLRDLGTVGANVSATLGNIMGPIQEEGGGLVNVLLQITGALRDATATQGFQQAMGALTSVMGTLASTVGPLIGQALAALGPVLTALGPPIEVLITALGDALGPVIEALGPVLTAAATAFGALIRAAAPLLTVIGQLVASLLPAVTPLFNALTTVFVALQPVISRIATILSESFAPILAGLSAIIAPLAQLIADQLVMWLGVLEDLLIELQPSLMSIGTSLGQLFVALAPLIQAFGQLSTKILSALLPVLTPLIELIGLAAAVFADQLASAVTNVVIPSLAILAAGLRSAATRMKPLIDAAEETSRLVAEAFRWLANILVGNSIIPDMINAIVKWFAGLPGRAASALSSLGSQISSRARDAGNRMVTAVRQKISEAVDVVRGFPGRASSALGGLGSRLYGAGQDLIRGMISGVQSMAGALVSAARGAVSSAVEGAKNLLGISSPSRVFAEIGQDTGAGFIEGLTGTRRRIETAVGRVARAVPESFQAPGVGGATSLLSATAGVGTVRATPAAAGPTAVTINVTVENRGVLGSEFEVQDFMAKAIDDLFRTGRLPAGLRAA